MEHAPEIGTRITYRPDWFGNGTTLVGVVKAVYEEDAAEYDDAGEFIRTLPGLAPERDWSVSMEVESELPDDWPYRTNCIAPRVVDIEPA